MILKHYEDFSPEEVEKLRQDTKEAVKKAQNMKSVNRPVPLCTTCQHRYPSLASKCYVFCRQQQALVNPHFRCRFYQVKP